MSAYYNENDPFAAQWLRNLIAAGHIASGEIDERSIVDVRPSDLVGFTQCHFFAGVGVWSYALRRAGWPDDRPVWTGSCPCQPFSAAGKGAGFADERHLWPAFFHLIGECGPDVVFGEQVASKDGLAWLDVVQADMEAAAYAFGAADTCAAGFGAPHIRQRLYWVANAMQPGWTEGRPFAGDRSIASSSASVLADAGSEGLEVLGEQPTRNQRQATERDGEAGRPGPTNGLWRDADWLFCRDGKWRPVEPGAFPLAHGVAGRVGQLRAYGNAINVEQATGFIEAYLDATGEIA